jgi:phenylalanyl-tRNA synthetase beta chain
MLVSWNWLKEYVPLSMSHEEAARRLMFAGLNHESTEAVADDFCIDLEITNNRPDCLGHIGIAREIGVLFNQPLTIPAAAISESAKVRVGELTSVTVECPQLCPRYIARVIRGVKIKPSPSWMQNRLRTIGVAVINNVVDITNYVLMECGQPLHAFDFHKLKGRKIIVRAAQANETFPAINHQTYTLDPSMCVIADAERPMALGGVMGGLDSEVSESTTELLIEAAEFSQLSIRSTARKLKLHSPSSYRFERGVDPAGVDWASRRCCELILNLAGGELAAGAIDVGGEPSPRTPITLRYSQVKRILGIEVPVDEILRVLAALSCVPGEKTSTTLTLTPPTWRRDLSREIDLVEEVARIHGYDKIPEDAAVPMAASHRSNTERVLATVRRVMTAAGFDEAMTTSVITPELSATLSPWSSAEPLATNQPMLKGTDRIRRSLLPSLLECREANEARGNSVIELFETAKIYLPSQAALPEEQYCLTATSGGDFFALKGVLETLLATLNPAAQLSVQPVQLPMLEFGKTVELQVNGEKLGFMGVVSEAGRKRFNLRGPAAVFEINLAVLVKIARLIPQYSVMSRHPAMTRDLNLIVDESIRWAELAQTVTTAAGTALETLAYCETYRDAKKDGPNKKRLLFSLDFRLPDRTLTSEEADEIRDRVITACRTAHAATLLGT